ncbi:D-alanyl-D-alanine dipeptidase [Chroococcidiopsis sp. CCALA 051]|uniref:M15 family metallopeptidase n=1 Tax=Chroococcidiopsis sp. CCALA 051 TaxID=869949 RepID=UPI000D0DB36A|nr:M15 family metallopeptidase [Chroococcidiopsis sp. CCALA 051]PSM48537.1 D-alanyl-D-alanine dipeptidase [Chroococcidiopsis sp. CCALA 051]
MKPYQQIQITECGEPLVKIPLEKFAVESPHPYQLLGAPYQGRSPYHLRQGVLDRLLQAQTYLQQSHPQWRIQIFDAYRPIAVQRFMVDYAFSLVLQAEGLTVEQLSPDRQQALWQQVYQIWAIPSTDPKTPPPHSTGAAVDITLVDAAGMTVNMGSPIDEMSARSQPDYFASSADPVEQKYHERRQLLQDIMLKAEFTRHPGEWWHFSFGDQMWAWLSDRPVAQYGGIV